MPKGFFPDFLSQERLAGTFVTYTPFPCDFVAALERRDSSRDIQTQLSFRSAWRIYTEWCTDKQNGGGQKWDSHREYNGEAFRDFLRDEVYYASQRANHEVPMTQVVDAFARSALDFFIYRCEWRTASPKREGVNIRRSLAPWINNPKLILSSNI